MTSCQISDIVRAYNAIVLCYTNATYYKSDILYKRELFKWKKKTNIAENTIFVVAFIFCKCHSLL